MVSEPLLKRAILFYDGLVKELERQGFQVATEGSDKMPYTSVKVDDDYVYLRLEEAGSFNRTKAKPEDSWKKYDYDYFTTGKLRLQISKYSWNHNDRTVSDTDHRKLEFQIEKIFKTILLVAEEAKEWRIGREEKAIRQEKLRIIRERQQREEILEQNKRADLEQASVSYTKSQYIYQYIQVVETQLVVNTLSADQFKKFVEWKTWVTEHADRLNPVKQKVEGILSCSQISTIHDS